MVVDDLLVEAAHQPVEGLRADALEPRVALAALPHAVDDVLARVHLPCHVDDGGLVVLKVSVDGYDGIAVVDALLQSGPQCILVAFVVGEFDALHRGVVPGLVGDELPRAVAAAVINQQQVGVGISLLTQTDDERLHLG